MLTCEFATQEKATEADRVKASREKITLEAAKKARQASSLHQQQLTQTEAKAFQLHEAMLRKYNQELEMEREAFQSKVAVLESSLAVMHDSQKQLTMSRVLQRMQRQTIRASWGKWRDAVAVRLPFMNRVTISSTHNNREQCPVSLLCVAVLLRGAYLSTRRTRKN